MGIFTVKNGIHYSYPLFLLGVFFISPLENIHCQSKLDLYSRLSFSVGLEKMYGFEMDALPFGLQYSHQKQILPALGIYYDFYRKEKTTIRAGIRLIRIIEKEFFVLPREYTNAEGGDFIFYVDTSTGFGDLRYELSLGYNYDIVNSKNIAFYLGTEGIFGYGQDTHPSIFEFYGEYQGFETQLVAKQSSPSIIYGKLGAEAGLKVVHPWFLIRVNFYYHYRLQNILEGTLVINNSNNERIERDYALKGDSYGLGISIYPKRKNKNK